MMNKSEYLYKLRQYLHGFSQDELQDILFDYEEHFDIGVSKGKSEEEISRELGDPKDIANNFKNNYKTNNYSESNISNYANSNDNSKKLLIILFLGLFNLVVVLGPYLGLAGLLLGCYGIGISFIVGGFLVLFGSPISFFMTTSSPHILTSLAFSIGLIALGILGLILSVYLSKLFISLTVRYARWNVNLINGEEAK